MKPIPAPVSVSAKPTPTPGPVEKWYRLYRSNGRLSVWAIETQDGRVVSRALALEPDIVAVALTKVADAMEVDARAEEEVRGRA